MKVLIFLFLISLVLSQKKPLAKGIDVSAWDKEIDFKKLKENGMEFVIIRSGTRFGAEENKIDAYFEQNYWRAKNASLPVGTYWFSYALSGKDAEREAEACLNTIKGKKFEYPIYIDIEDKSIFAKKVEAEVAKSFCKVMKEHKYYCGVYSGKYHFTKKFDDEVRKNLSLWVAQWAKECTYKGDYGVWQYTSDGHVPGLSGRADLNYAYKDFPKIIKEGHWNGY